MKTEEIENRMDDFCPTCRHFDDKIGVCSSIHENIYSYPARFNEKCNGKLYEQDEEKIRAMEEVEDESAVAFEKLSVDEKLTYLFRRIEDLESGLPQSDIIHPNFWKRAWTVFGYNFATALIIYGVILGIALIFGILRALVR